MDIQGPFQLDGRLTHEEGRMQAASAFLDS